jgi:hypothetical protein
MREHRQGRHHPASSKDSRSFLSHGGFYDSFMKTPILSTNYVHRSLGRSALLFVSLLIGCFGPNILAFWFDKLDGVSVEMASVTQFGLENLSGRDCLAGRKHCQ